LVKDHIGEGQLQQVRIEDLLARDPVPPDDFLLKSSIENKSILVTGAGGSIGSELVRQIVELGPKRIVGIDISEEAIWRLRGDFENVEAEIHLSVCSVLDRVKLSKLMQVHEVDVVYHAAAYKHVPILEENPLEGIRTNFFGTLSCAKAAIESGVSKFVLISTDKAVAPTSVLGASKQLAERLVAKFSSDGEQSKFITVRFGNVLGSSGSVIPTFDRQIRRGGPVTLTDPNVTRYFMTIQEACQLVIQASSLGKGGEIFVLDMGEPVRIMALAQKMIHLMGKVVSDDTKQTSEGIKIEITGLRPGEKLHEQIFENNSIKGTQHPRILASEAHFRKDLFLDDRIDRLRFLVEEGEESRAVDFMWRMCEHPTLGQSEKVVKLTHAKKE
jgi:FlaA1/EpsC-like NDP-sugar epimerase